MTAHAILLIVLCLLPFPLSAANDDSDVQLQMEISASYASQENFLQRDRLGLLDGLDFSKDRTYSLIDINPSLTIRPSQWFYGYLGADVIWENPVEDPQDDEVQGVVSAAYLSFKGKHFQMDIGIQPIEFGSGFIFADDVPGAVIQANTGKGYTELKAVRVLDSSPMVGATLGYRPDYLEHVELFGIWLSDQDDVFAQSIPLKYQILFDLSSEGDLFYVGGDANLFVGESLLSFVGAYQTGRFTTRNQDGKSADTDVEAYFGDISLERNLADWCSVGIFFHLASGDDTPFNRRTEAFLSVTPYNHRATLFFDPAFRDNNESDRFTYGNGFFGGVMAPGITLTLLSEGGLSAEAALIYLYAHQDLDDGSQRYGWEADLTVSYTFGDKFRLYVDAARFEHGDYFESLLDETVDPAVKFMVGMQASF